MTSSAPLVHAQALDQKTADAIRNDAAPTRTGLGDAYAQLLTIPYFTPKFAVAVGSGLGIPTATDDLLGTGRWVVAPAVAPVWFLQGRGMFFVRVQNSMTVGSDQRRPDINVFIVAPTFIHSVGRRFWVLADTETQTDWRRDERTSVKSGGGRTAAGCVVQTVGNIA